MPQSHRAESRSCVRVKSQLGFVVRIVVAHMMMIVMMIVVMLVIEVVMTIGMAMMMVNFFCNNDKLVIVMD